MSNIEVGIFIDEFPWRNGKKTDVRRPIRNSAHILVPRLADALRRQLIKLMNSFSQVARFTSGC